MSAWGKRDKRGAEGFTLLEFLAVLTIIAILTAIAVPVISSLYGIAHRSNMHSDLRQAAQQMEIAKLKDGDYPKYLPVDFRASNGYSMRLAPISGPPVAPAIKNFQDSMAGLGLTGDGPDGVAATAAFTQDSITVRISCPSSFLRSGEVRCNWAGRTNSNPTYSMPSTSKVCERPDGKITISSNGLLAGPLSKPQTAGYVVGSPQDFTVSDAGSNVCNSGVLLGFGFKDSMASGKIIRIALAGGVAVPPPPPPGYCLESTSSKTDQIFSYRRPVGEMVSGPC